MTLPDAVQAVVTGLLEGTLIGLGLLVAVAFAALAIGTRRPTRRDYDRKYRRSLRGRRK
jgi:hypothetical protein